MNTRKMALYALLTTALIVLLLGCVRVGLHIFSTESDTRTNNLAPSILSIQRK